MLRLGRQTRFIASMEQAAPREAESSVKNRCRKHETQSTQAFSTGSLASTLSTQLAEEAGSDAPGTVRAAPEPRGHS